jgi:HPt (histidine-containing phosphotransfer) domain-containing protein
LQEGGNKLRLGTGGKGVGMSSVYKELAIETRFEDREDVAFDRMFLVQHTMESAELEREIIDLFLKQLPEILTKLLAAPTPEQWKFHTHTLKGSALAVGAFKIGGLARALELPAHRGPSKQRTELIHRLQIAVAEFEDIAQRIYRS